MATGLTLKAMRDQVRRDMEIIPLFDVTANAGDVGSPSPGQPDPNNTTINAALNDGIAALNAVVRLGAMTTFTVAVTAPAVTYRGIFYVDASSAIPNALVATEILDIGFDDGTNYNRLEPYTFYAATKQKGVSQWQNYAPGRPAQWLASGHQIGLAPPPLANGTLHVTAAGGIPPLVNDADIIAVCPVEYQVAALYFAVMLCSMRRASDAEAAQRAQTFGNLAMQRMMQAYQFKNGFEATGIESVQKTLQMIFSQAGSPGIPTVPFMAMPQPQGQG